jgi:hypothetical protein
LGLLKSIYRLAQIRHMVRLSNAVCIRVVFVGILVLLKGGLGLPIDARSNERMATLWCPKQVRGTAARGAPDLPVHRSKEVDRGLNELARFLHVVGMCLPPAELEAPQKACQMAAIIACESDLMGRQGRVALEPLEREMSRDSSGPTGVSLAEGEQIKIESVSIHASSHSQRAGRGPLGKRNLSSAFSSSGFPRRRVNIGAWGSKSSPLLEEKTWSEKVAFGYRYQKTGSGSQSVARLPSSRCFSDEANQSVMGIIGPGDACKSAVTALHSPGVLPPHGPQGDNLDPL